MQNSGKYNTEGDIHVYGHRTSNREVQELMAIRKREIGACSVYTGLGLIRKTTVIHAFVGQSPHSQDSLSGFSRECLAGNI